MLLQEANSISVMTDEEIVNVNNTSKYQQPINKAYFEDVLISSASSKITAGIVSFLNDYFLTKSCSGLVGDKRYFITIGNKVHDQDVIGVEERNNFTDIHTTINFSNISSKRTFMISYTTQSEMFYFNFQKDYVFDILSPADRNKIELAGFIETKVYYSLAFLDVIYNYLENQILDLEVSTASIQRH